MQIQDVYVLEVGLLGEGAGGRVLPCVSKSLSYRIILYRHFHLRSDNNKLDELKLIY